jgi:hypothetical protein
MRNPFCCFNSSPEVIRLTEMMYVSYPLSLRQGDEREDASRRGHAWAHAVTSRRSIA